MRDLSQNRRNDLSHHVAHSQNKAPDHNRHGHVALIDEVVKVELGGQFVESNVTNDDQQYREEAKSKSRDEVAKKEFGQVC